MKTLILAGLLTISLSSNAADFRKSKPGESYQEVNGVSVVVTDGASFSIVDITDKANAEPTNEADDGNKYLQKVKSGLSLDQPVSEEEAVKVLDVYYRNVAFDPDSIVVKDLTLGTHGVRTWCMYRLFKKCGQFYGAAGTLVEFDVNGKNRSGGMTGYSHSVVLIRKFHEESKTGQ